MRIVFYSHMSQLGNGGVESLLGIVKELSSRHDCCVVTPSSGSLNTTLNRLGIQNVVLPYKWSSSGVSTSTTLLSMYKQWFVKRAYNNRVMAEHVRFLKTYQPDVLYSNTSVINIGVKLSELLHLPHVWHVREFQMFNITPDFGHWYLKKYLNNSTRVIVNSQLLQNYYQQYVASNRLHLVYNGVAPPSVMPSIKKMLVSDDAVCKFIVVGALISGKSQMDVIQAARQLTLKLPTAAFEVHLVGSGPLKAEFESYIAAHQLENVVILHGHQSNVDAFYKETNCYVMCSEYETFGRVTVEAMLCGLPILGRNAPYNATKEIIRPQTDGLLYTTIDELVEHMEWVIENRSRADEMGQNAKQWAKDNFLIERCAEQIEQHIMACVH
ncbi:MAG: glycosyltransferase family 4 protein [Flavobacteriaceae bacterium]